MSIEGYNLMLQDFCDYCQYFNPEVERIDCTSFGESKKFINNIRCVNRQKCARIADNLEKKIKDGKSET